LCVENFFFNKKVVPVLQLQQAGTTKALPRVVLGNKAFFLQGKFYAIALTVDYIAHLALKKAATTRTVFNFMHKLNFFAAVD
jgi:hypothetical protein